MSVLVGERMTNKGDGKDLNAAVSKNTEKDVNRPV